MRFILASQSIGRKKILESLKIPFKVIPSTVDEDKIVGKTPVETLKLRARAKGADVAKKNFPPSNPPNPSILSTPSNPSWLSCTKSRVTVRKLSKEDILRYVSLTDYASFAGGYTLFGTPQDFVTQVSGSLTNVVGLPLEKMIPFLKTQNILTQ